MLLEPGTQTRTSGGRPKGRTRSESGTDAPETCTPPVSQSQPAQRRRHSSGTARADRAYAHGAASRGCPQSRNDKTPDYQGFCVKRMKGFEPSTFAMANPEMRPEARN
jgi:hypothetical protein